MTKQRIMYVCSECADGCPEACGHYDRNELRVMPDGMWLCESCFDNNDDNEFLSWGHLPAPEEYGRIPASAQQAVEPLDEVFIEAWHGARKITVYRSTVIRVWGENIDTEMSNEPRTLNSVQAALDWLYAVPEGENPIGQGLRRTQQTMCAADMEAKIAALAHRFWSIHPSSLDDMGLTREEFYAHEMTNLLASTLPEGERQNPSDGAIYAAVCQRSMTPDERAGIEAALLASTEKLCDLEADMVEHRFYRDALIEECAQFLEQIAYDFPVTESSRRHAADFAAQLGALSSTERSD